MFLADGEEMPRPAPPWEGCPCSRPVTSSIQPRSCLSPPEKGNRSLGSSTLERELGFAFQQLGTTAGETPRSVTTSGQQHDAWSRRGVCLELSASAQRPGTEETCYHPQRRDRVWPGHPVRPPQAVSVLPLQG